MTSTDQAPTSAGPAYAAPASVARVWSPLAVAVYSLVLAYPASLILAVKNWRALGMYKEAGRHVLGAIALSMPVIGLLIFAPPRPARIFMAALNIAAFSYLKAKLGSDIADAQSANPALRIEYRRWYSALGWVILGLLLFVLLAFIIFMTLVFANVPIPDQ